MPYTHSLLLLFLDRKRKRGVDPKGEEKRLAHHLLPSNDLFFSGLKNGIVVKYTWKTSHVNSGNEHGNHLSGKMLLLVIVFLMNLQALKLEIRSYVEWLKRAWHS